ncbi:MAG: phage major capsid protein [Pseudomonadota bacterium]|nr:phage major capsid protein [Pseudomonadota bacterium]
MTVREKFEKALAEVDSILASVKEANEELTDQQEQRVEWLLARAEEMLPQVREEDRDDFKAELEAARKSAKPDPKVPTGTLHPIAPAAHTRGKRSYSLGNLIRAALDPSVDAAFEKEIAQELRGRMPWAESAKLEGTLVPLGAVLGMSRTKAGSTETAGNLVPLLGTDYQDELIQIDGAVTRATITDKIGARMLTGLTEKTVQFPRQTGQMTAGHVALDANLPTATDPTFDTVTLAPKLVGAVTELKLSSVFAQHPQAGTPQWISAELQRALTVEINRAILSGDNTTTPAEPDGLSVQATTATQATVTVDGTASTGTIGQLNALKAQMLAYLQVDADAAERLRFINHPLFLSALEAVPVFTGAAQSIAQTITTGGAFRVPMVEAQILPVTPGATDTAEAFLVADPEYLLHAFWQAASVVVNPFADSVFAAGGTLVRVSLLHDFLVGDPKRVLKTVTNLA